MKKKERRKKETMRINRKGRRKCRNEKEIKRTKKQEILQRTRVKKKVIRKRKGKNEEGNNQNN